MLTYPTETAKATLDSSCRFSPCVASVNYLPDLVDHLRKREAALMIQMKDYHFIRFLPRTTQENVLLFDNSYTEPLFDTEMKFAPVVRLLGHFIRTIVRIRRIRSGTCLRHICRESATMQAESDSVASGVCPEGLAVDGAKIR